MNTRASHLEETLLRDSESYAANERQLELFAFEDGDAAEPSSDSHRLNHRRARAGLLPLIHAMAEGFGMTAPNTRRAPSAFPRVRTNLLRNASTALQPLCRKRRR
jgi:hypothetical protein